jgi:uncharacterized protein
MRLRSHFDVIGTLLAIGLSTLAISGAQAQTPTAEATAAARSLVETMKMTDQFKAMLPTILQALKPAIVQDRPEVAGDYDAAMPRMLEAFAPYYQAMVDGIVDVYANNFTAEELLAIEEFYRQPVGKKMLDKTPTILQQSMQVGQTIGRKAAEDLRNRMADELRAKGHKM